VPEGVAIVAMGNRDTDKGITFKMATPISNRFVHIEMRHDFDDWQRWALGAFLKSDDGANLQAAAKRASNILAIETKKDGDVFGGDVVPAGHATSGWDLAPPGQ
jgi:hypothetical protein